MNRNVAKAASRAEIRRITTRAREHEIEGNFYAAHFLWKEAQRHSTIDANRAWYKCRAEICLRRDNRMGIFATSME